MIAKSRGIVLRNTNYSENSLVVKVFTDVYGIQSFLVNGIRNNKGQIKRSVLQPLNLLELEVYLKPNGGLQRIKEARPFPLLNHLHRDMVKCSIAMFMLELLNRTLPDEDPLEDLYEFLHEYIQFIDQTTDDLTLIPHHFMLQLSRYLGFFPELETKEGYTLHLKEGKTVFEPDGSVGYALNMNENDLLLQLQNLNPAALSGMKSSRSVRQSLLSKLLFYYQLHIAGGMPFKSVSILQQVLHPDGTPIAETNQTQTHESR